MRASLLFLGIALAAPAVTRADLITVVDAHAGPWQFASGDLNSTFQYGVGDQSAPVVVDASSGFSFAAGGVFTIEYLSGTTRTFPGAHINDANGDPNSPLNDATGPPGHASGPSFFFDHADYPANLMALVGTFADSSGSIVGTPFLIGDLRSVVVPVGASQLQLGLNDGTFHDNVGSLTVRISGPAAVPEPATAVLMGIGLAGLGVWRRVRR